MRKWTIPAAVALAVFALFGCNDSSNTTEPPLPVDSGEPNYEERLTFAWQKFGSGNYEGAKVIFEELIENNTLLADAYTGLGWCNANLNSLDAAVLNFNQALLNQPSEELANDIHAGLSFTYDAKNLSSQCLSTTEKIDPDWEFEHRVDLDYDDIIALRAMNYYAMGSFQSSLVEVRRLDPYFSAQVGTVEGRAALAGKIEALGAGG